MPPGDDDRPITYGMSPWRKMFSRRQQIAHGYCVPAFRELADEDTDAGQMTDMRRAAWRCVALGVDKLISTISMLCLFLCPAQTHRRLCAGQ